jgi:uncharacterized membrane protein
MNKNRLEAFSGGVIAIIITIMVLELKVPHGAELSDLAPLLPVFLGYVLSFVYVAIYWNNRQHMLHTLQRVNGTILWANLHLLFWLSLVPFTTAWMGENHLAPLPATLYGANLFFAGTAYVILQATIIGTQGKESALARAVADDLKSKFSFFANLAGAVIAYFQPIIAVSVFVLIALVWLIPDRRIEKVVAE